MIMDEGIGRDRAAAPKGRNSQVKGRIPDNPLESPGAEVSEVSRNFEISPDAGTEEARRMPIFQVTGQRRTVGFTVPFFIYSRV
jgi:hypothetical protein